MILLHGFGQNSTVWNETVARLPAGAHLTPDLRGHGSNRLDPSGGEGDLVSDCLDLAATQPQELLVGYSMGGRIAMRAVLENQDLFSGLVLISTTPGIADPTMRKARLESDLQLAELLEGGQVDEFERRWQGADIWQSQPEKISAISKAMRSESNAVALAQSLRSFGSGAIQPVWGRLAEIRIPVLVVVGGLDPTYLSIAEQMTEAISDSELLVVESCGHSIPLEAGPLLAAGIESFSRRRLQAGS
jgi:2-succinyl-6-hydroxy-2,4-cyclohexadiene-1-carboxylate synthase